MKFIAAIFALATYAAFGNPTHEERHQIHEIPHDETVTSTLHGTVCNPLKV